MSQVSILSKMADFLDLRLQKLQKNSPPETELISLIESLRDKMRTTGYCHGFAVTYGVMCVLKKKDWWEGVLQAIERWDGKATSLASVLELPDANPKEASLESLFDRAIDYITVSQANLKQRPDIYPLQQNEFLKKADPSQDLLTKTGARLKNVRLEITSEEKKSIRKSGQSITTTKNEAVGGKLTKENFISLLATNIKYIKNNLFLISKVAHACNLSIDEDGNFLFYDPNYPDNKSRKFTNLEMLYEEVFTRLGSDISFNLSILEPNKLASGEKPFAKFYEWIQDEKMRDSLFQGEGLSMACKKNDINAILIWNQLKKYEKVRYLPDFIDFSKSYHRNDLYEKFKIELTELAKKGEIKFIKTISAELLPDAEDKKDEIKKPVKIVNYHLNGRLVELKKANLLFELLGIEKDPDHQFCMAKYYYDHGKIKKSLELCYASAPKNLCYCLEILVEIYDKSDLAEKKTIITNLELLESKSKCSIELSKVYNDRLTNTSSKIYIINSLIKLNCLETLAALYKNNSTSVEEREHILAFIRKLDDPHIISKFALNIADEYQPGSEEDFLIDALTCHQCAHELGNYDSTKRLEEILTELKDYVNGAQIPTALYQLAYCYDNGIGVAQNKPEAFKLYKLAADKGHIKAQRIVAKCYQHDSYGKINILGALNYYGWMSKTVDEKASQEIKTILKKPQYACEMAERIAILVTKMLGLDNFKKLISEIIKKLSQSFMENSRFRLFLDADQKYFKNLEKTLKSTRTGYVEVFAELLKSTYPALLETIMQRLMEFFLPGAGVKGEIPASENTIIFIKRLAETCCELAKPISAACIESR